MPLTPRPALALALALSLAPALAPTMASADPVLGIWKTQPGDDGAYGHVTMTTCGSKICGTVTRGFDSSGTERTGGAVGRKIVWDMAPQGGGAYGGGKIYAPDRDKTYRSKMKLSGSSLRVSGCVGPICRAQTWTRVR